MHSPCTEPAGAGSRRASPSGPPIAACAQSISAPARRRSPRSTASNDRSARLAISAAAGAPSVSARRRSSRVVTSSTSPGTIRPADMLWYRSCASAGPPIPGGTRSSASRAASKAPRESPSTQRACPIALAAIARWRGSAANAAAADPLPRAMAASAIGQARWVLGDSRGAFEAAREALDLVPPGMGGPAEAQLLYHSMSAGRIVPGLVDEVTTLLERRRADTDGAPAAAEIARRALLSFDAVLRGDRRRAGAEIDWAQAAIVGPDGEALLLPAPAGSVHGLCMWLLGRYEESQAIYDREVERARERGSLLELAVCLEGRIACSWARGDVNACLADVETLLGLNEEL